ncbi:anti-sigma factor [Evansella sp. AB-P1]|uniref:anti-sigma factor n=1 Tax=Evansella sp. AB-P1 TaxID=3037653 RepID=UPI00241D9C83|nr:anti-sigma factor [Evansella sp. AB-P1]MDG5788601.1 anti-sigma factor [Evansella sp. AB-P1]
MKCNDVKAKWHAYINGECTYDEEKAIESHIQQCSDCEKLLNKDLEDQEEEWLGKRNKLDNKKEKTINDLPQLKQRELIRKAKWKNRYSNVVTFVSLFIIISVISGIFTAGFYAIGGDRSISQTATQVVRTTTQMTMPNIYIGSGGLNTNFYFNLDINYTIHQQVGRERQAIGELNGKMILHRLNVNREWSDGQFDVKLHFLHPEYVENESDSEKEFFNNWLNKTWEALDYLPEGTVSEVAITFDQLYELDEVYDILDGFDLDIPWYAIHTGTEHDGNDRGSPYLNATGGIWGLNENSIFDFSPTGGSVPSRGGGDVRAEAFKTGLQFLADNERVVRQYKRHMSRDVSIQERVDYVKEHGVKTYGVVITGPTKEILRLQESHQIIYATLGEVDFWNWNGSPASGTIYN